MFLNVRATLGTLLSIIIGLGSCGCTAKQSRAEQIALLNVELGLGYLEQDQRARAKTKLTHALALAPKLPQTHGAMAYFREKVGDYQEADRLYKQAINLSSHTKGAVYNNYGAYLCRQAQYTAADQAFQQALQDKAYARTAEVYENAGLCALKSSKTDLVQKAQSYLRQAIQHDPTREQAKQALVTLAGSLS